MVSLICKICGNTFEVEQRRKDSAKYCGYKCYWEAKKEKQPEHLKEKAFQKGNKINLGRPRPDVTARNRASKTFFGNVVKNQIELGKIIHNKYVWLYLPNHPAANSQGYVREHRVVMEKHIGRFLTGVEVVHHIDGNTLNNDISNLQLFRNHSEHMKHHAEIRK